MACGTLAARSDGRRRGAALPIVLLFAALVSGLAASAMRSSLSGVAAASAFAEAARADELGRGAADALSFHLATHDKTARRGGRLAVHLPQAEVTLDYGSESARVDANLAPPALIAALLAAAGAEPADADAAAGRIRDFRERASRDIAQAKRTAAARQDAASQAGAADAPVPSVAPPPGPGSDPKPLAIRDTAEIARAWDLPDALARRVLPSLTVSNGTPQVDPLLAGRLVLAALLGADERVDDYLERRRNGFATEASALALLPVPSRAFAGFHDSEAVRAVARVALPHGFTRRYEMVVVPARPAEPGVADSGPAAVPVVASWRKLP